MDMKVLIISLCFIVDSSIVWDWLGWVIEFLYILFKKVITKNMYCKKYLYEN